MMNLRVLIEIKEIIYLLLIVTAINDTALNTIMSHVHQDFFFFQVIEKGFLLGKEQPQWW
jgi:hypothetical protein